MAVTRLLGYLLGEAGVDHRHSRVVHDAGVAEVGAYALQRHDVAVTHAIVRDKVVLHPEALIVMTCQQIDGCG